MTPPRRPAQARPAARDLLRPRRILVAAFLFATLAAASVAAAGLGSRLQAGAPLPEAFHLAGLRVGDRGNYTWARVHGEGPGARIVSERPLLTFEWLEAQTIPDAHDRLRATNPLLEWQWPNGGVGNPAQRSDGHVLSLDQQDGSVVAVARVWEWLSGPQHNTAETTYNSQYSLDRAWTRPGDGGHRAPSCGLVSPYQGGLLPLQGWVRPFPGCQGEFDRQFRPVGTGLVGSRPAVVFSSPGADEMQAWFEEGIPVPVLLTRRDPRSPEWHDAFRLVRFTRGHEPLAWGVPSDRGAAAGWDFAPLQGRLPSEQGVGHPFPASAALAAALRDPNATTFQQVLDRGYLSRLSSRAFVDHGTERHSWTLDASDGDLVARVRVSFERRDPEGGGPGGLGLPLLAREGATVAVEPSPPRRDRTPPPGAVPGEAPTVASLLARWRDHASDRFEALEPPAWGFRVLCGDPDCGTALLEYTAGVDLDRRWSNRSALGLGGTEAGTLEMESLYSETSAPGRAASARLHEAVDRDGPAQVPVHASARAASEGPVAVQGTVAWTPPSPAVLAGGGLAALLVALGYLLWPAAKHGAWLGLFSRAATPEQVLSHPVRRALLQEVEARPGIHLRELQRRTGLANHQLQHHVDRLQAAGAVRLAAGSGYVCLYAAGSGAAAWAGAAGSLKSGAARGVLAAAVASPGLGARAAARRLGLSPGTVSHHVRRLRDAGLLDPAHEGLVATGLGAQAAAAMGAGARGA